MKIVAIIPARGGSKGIKCKNLIPILGKPLLCHTINAAQESELIDKIIVSTDDKVISKVAKENGVEVILRPQTLSNDTAISEDALKHAIDTLREQQYIPDLIVFLQGTSPLRGSNDIDNAINYLIKEKADSLFSGSYIHGFIWEKTDKAITPINYNPISRKMRQHIKKTYIEENGSIYIFKPKILEDYHCRLGGKIVAFEMNPLYSFQIDEPSDVSLIEKIGTSLILP